MKDLMKQSIFLLRTFLRPWVIFVSSIFYVWGIIFVVLLGVTNKDTINLYYAMGLMIIAYLLYNSVFLENILRIKGIRVFPKIASISTKSKLIVLHLFLLIYSFIIFLVLGIVCLLNKDTGFSLTILLEYYILGYIIGIILAGLGGKLQIIQSLLLVSFVYIGLPTIMKYKNLYLLEMSHQKLVILVVLGSILANLISFKLTKHCYRLDLYINKKCR